MRDLLARPVAAARRAAATTLRLGARANTGFVAFARRAEVVLLRGAASVASQAFAPVPRACEHIAKTATRLGEQSAQRVDASSGVFAASLPPAFERTAATVEALANVGRQRADRFVDAVLRPSGTTQEAIEEAYRKIGRAVASLAHDGLETALVSESVRSYVDEIQRLRASRSPMTQEMR